MKQGLAYIGPSVGLRKRVTQITDDESTDYSRSILTTPIQPTWDLGRFQEERIGLFNVGPTAASAEPQVLFNDDALLAKLNSARRIRFNGWSVASTGATGTWAIQTNLEVNLAGTAVTIVPIAGWQFDNIGAGDAVRQAVYDLNFVLDLEAEHWNEATNEFQDLRITSLLFRGENHVGGTGSYANVYIDLSLLY